MQRRSFRKGKIVACYAKHHLPNYGVFDEQRLFEAGERPMILQIGDFRIGLHICEDSWVEDISHASLLKELRLDVLVNLSASPFHRAKYAERLHVLGQTCATLGTSMAYCNLVGGQDELVFDGGSLLLDASGKEMARAKRFEEDLLIGEFSSSPIGPESETVLPEGVDWLVLDPTKPDVSISLPPLPLTPLEDELEEVYRALCLGLKDYKRKRMVFSPFSLRLAEGLILLWLRSRRWMPSALRTCMAFPFPPVTVRMALARMRFSWRRIWDSRCRWFRSRSCLKLIWNYWPLFLQVRR